MGNSVPSPTPDCSYGIHLAYDQTSIARLDQLNGDELQRARRSHAYLDEKLPGVDTRRRVEPRSSLDTIGLAGRRTRERAPHEHVAQHLVESSLHQARESGVIGLEHVRGAEARG